MTEKTIKYLPLPTVCAACVNQLLDDATADPHQFVVSVYCVHHHTIITGQCVEIDGERVIGMWTASGPISEEDAMDGLTRMAKYHGFETTVNRGLDSVN